MPNKDIRFIRMKCPQCGNTYFLEGAENCVWEVCPFGCGYRGELTDFEME
jgi:ribosomal protein S27E